MTISSASERAASGLAESRWYHPRHSPKQVLKGAQFFDEGSTAIQTDDARPFLAGTQGKWLWHLFEKNERFRALQPKGA